MRSVTDAYSLHEKTVDENETIVQTSQLEVIVTGNQHTVTFNEVPVIAEELDPNK